MPERRVERLIFALRVRRLTNLAIRADVVSRAGIN